MPRSRPRPPPSPRAAGVAAAPRRPPDQRRRCAAPRRSAGPRRDRPGVRRRAGGERHALGDGEADAETDRPGQRHADDHDRCGDDAAGDAAAATSAARRRGQAFGNEADLVEDHAERARIAGPGDEGRRDVDGDPRRTRARRPSAAPLRTSCHCGPIGAVASVVPSTAMVAAGSGRPGPRPALARSISVHGRERSRPSKTSVTRPPVHANDRPPRPRTRWDGGRGRPPPPAWCRAWRRSRARRVGARRSRPRRRPLRRSRRRCARISSGCDVTWPRGHPRLPASRTPSAGASAA